MSKRKPRGKAKPTSIEVKRLARDIDRLLGLEANPPLHEENRATVRWATHWAKQRFVKQLVRELRHFESKAERVICARWPYWNAEGLQWKERQSKMKKLGFPKFEKMPGTTFKSLCTRKLGLKYRAAK